MDPQTLIVTALALGAAAGLKDTATQVVKDAYAGLKSLIQRRYAGVDLSAVERKPDSEAKRDSLAEDLAEAGAATDETVLRQAQELIQLVQRHAPDAAATVRVSLADIETAGSMRVSDLLAAGPGAKVEADLRNVKAGGDLTVDGLTAGTGTDDPKKHPPQ
jgi:hypothetical protein